MLCTTNAIESELTNSLRRAPGQSSAEDGPGRRNSLNLADVSEAANGYTFGLHGWDQIGPKVDLLEVPHVL